MTRDTSLRGGGISLRTDSDKSDMSFNSARKSFVSQAEYEAALVTNGSWSGYIFNCSAESLGGGEYALHEAQKEIAKQYETEEEGR